VYALIGLASAWLAGIACASSLHLSLAQWLIVAVGCAICALASRRQAPLRLLFACAAMFCLGGLRMSAAHPRLAPGLLGFYAGIRQPLTLTGVVSAYPEEEYGQTTLRVRAESVQSEEDAEPRPVRGMAVISADASIRWAYGDRVQAVGQLQRPVASGESPYAAYLARQGVQGWMPRADTLRLATRQGNPLLHWLDDLRRIGLRSIHDLFPQPEAGLLAGILLGVESGISDEVMKAFTRTNTSHIIAISGFNIALLSAIFVQGFGHLLGARRGALAAGIAIAAYTLLVGASASVVRAAWMAGLALLARWLGRTTEALLSLLASALLMTLIHPFVLFDVGFQLSFAATLGLIVYAAPLQDRTDAWLVARLDPAWARHVASPLAAMVLVTLAAQLTTLPLTVYYFERLSLVALPANAVILPLQPALMILGGIAMLLGMVWPPVAQPVAWVAWLFPALTIRVVELFAASPGASVPVGAATPGSVLLYYLLLLGCTLGLRRIRVQPLSQSAASLARTAGPAALAVCAILVWKAGVDRPDGRLSMTVLETGGGQGVLITSPTGRSILVGGGAEATPLRESISRRLPLFHRSLDWLILGASDSDSLAGLRDISEHLSIEAGLICGEPRAPWSVSLLAELAAAGTKLEPAASGQRLELGGDATLEVLHASDEGCLLLVRHGRSSVLLAPGIEPESVEAAARRGPLPVTAYNAASGGHPAVNPVEWLETLSPRVVILAADPAERVDASGVREYASAHGILVLDTMRYGWIRLETDGERLWVTTARSLP
jgi:competence protein ComEC